jgi:hypothetical protein
MCCHARPSCRTVKPPRDQPLSRVRGLASAAPPAAQTWRCCAHKAQAVVATGWYAPWRVGAARVTQESWLAGRAQSALHTVIHLPHASCYKLRVCTLLRLSARGLEPSQDPPVGVGAEMEAISAGSAGEATAAEHALHRTVVLRLLQLLSTVPVPAWQGEHELSKCTLCSHPTVALQSRPWCALTGASMLLCYACQVVTFRRKRGEGGPAPSRLRGARKECGAPRLLLQPLRCTPARAGRQIADAAACGGDRSTAAANVILVLLAGRDAPTSIAWKEFPWTACAGHRR